MDVLNYWQRVAAANMSLASSAVRIGEMLAATMTVVRVRSDMIGAGMQSPLDIDWGEMNRMVSEKIFALGKSGSAANKELGAVQSKLLADWQQAAMLPFSAASPFAATGVGERLASIGLEMFESTARLTQVALEPVHRTVTANARRLG